VASEKQTVIPFPHRLEKNPYCELLYTHLERQGVRVIPDARFDLDWLKARRAEAEVIHLHWIGHLYRHWRGGLYNVLSSSRFLQTLLQLRRLEYRLVWTLHNFAPHDSRGDLFDASVRRKMLRWCRVICHCETARRMLDPQGQRENVFVIPHGHYMDRYPNTISRDEARRRLGLPGDAKVFLAFGLQRFYKGNERLIRLFDRPGWENRHLLIVGEPLSEDEQRQSREREGRQERANVHYHYRFVPEEEVQVFFQSCDFAVFNFGRVLTSGSVILALSMGRPVIVPDVGCLSELKDGREALKFPPGDLDALARAIERSCSLDSEALGAAAKQMASRWDWDSIAKAHAQVYGF